MGWGLGWQETTNNINVPKNILSIVIILTRIETELPKVIKRELKKRPIKEQFMFEKVMLKVVPR